MDEKDTSHDAEPLGDVNDSSDSEFEDELAELLLRSFGEGKDVEGVWDLEYEPEEIPDWTVTIDRKDRF